MSDVGYHLVLRLGDGRVLATNAEQRRILTATIARVGRPRGVVAWDGIDEHAHVAACTRRLVTASERPAEGGVVRAGAARPRLAVAVPGTTPVRGPVLGFPAP